MHRSPMDRFKTFLRIAGIVIAAIGLMFLPSRNFVFDKGDLSTFNNWADVGVFAYMGGGLIAVGVVLIGVSFFIRGKLTD
jgi:hypothetical protein